MPSEKILEQKKKVVSELADTLSSSVAGVIVDYKGITVDEDTKLRKELREAGVKYAVVKNTILKLAAEKADLSDIDDVLEGTTAIATSAEDHVAAARILSKFAENSKTFTIKKGFLDGKVIGVETVESLAKLPSKDVLLATVCNAFNAPIAAFARAMQALVEKGGATPVPAEEAAAEA
ncbi:MAG: 50S ribosomal protein L10 [Oscillospiraceae bacterium]|nr:50S ribosomal protein L10 [Oscillospiraceae bacterium]